MLNTMSEEHTAFNAYLHKVLLQPQQMRSKMMRCLNAAKDYTKVSARQRVAISFAGANGCGHSPCIVAVRQRRTHIHGRLLGTVGVGSYRWADGITAARCALVAAGRTGQAYAA